MLFLVACAGGVKTIPPILEGFSLLGDTLWSVPVPIQGGRERVGRLHDARERLARSPGDFEAAYDVARYTADLGRFSKAIELYGTASAMGGLDPRPYARRAELYLLLRRVDRALSDLRTAGRIFDGVPITEQQVTSGGEMIPRNFSYYIPSLLAITYTVRGDSARALESISQSAQYVESLREAIQTTLWFRAWQPGADFPKSMPSRFRSATNAMIRSSTRVAAAGACPIVTGTMIDSDLTCYVHGVTLLARGRRAEATAAFGTIMNRSHWSSQAHLAAEAAMARLQTGTESGLGGRRASK